MSRGPYPIMLMLAMSLPGAVRALGLGDIRVDSALNEPLSAQIDIVGATRDELIALTAKVANREVFQHYGADRPGFLATATFKVGTDSAGRPVLNVRSSEAFTDPVVNFLVDIRWGKGELIREYSLLLDPAGFGPATRPSLATAAPVVTYTPPGPSEPAQVAEVTKLSPPPTRAAPAHTRAQGILDTTGSTGARHRVALRDTLRGIARQAGARTETHAQRMMIAIFRANPHAFDGNINRLHLGAVLDMPSDDAVTAIDPVEAKREVRAQMTAWRMDGRPAASRAALAAVTPAAPAPDAGATDALKSRVQQLEKALEEVHQQLASESAKIQDLKQQAGRLPVTAPTPVDPVPVRQGTAAAAELTTAQVAPPAPAAPAVAETAASPPSPVQVEVMQIAQVPAPQAVAAPAAPPASGGDRSWWSAVAIAAGLALAGFALLRRRLARRDSPVIQAPMVVEEHPAPLEVLREQSAAKVEAVKSAPVQTPMSRSLERSASVDAIVAKEISMRAPAPEARDDMGIDTDLLERSYLDALGIDAAATDTGAHTVVQEALEDDTATHDTSDLNTVRLDTSELDTAVNAAMGAAGHKSDLNTVILDTRAPTPAAATADLPAAVSNTVLDYNLLDLDATAQHVHMPSDLHDNAVVTERRTNIVDVLKLAIERDPQRRDLRMKLLETYYSTASTNQRAFLEVVRKLSRDHEFLSSEDWKKVVMMGREIAPEDILFTDIAKGDDLADCA